MEGRAYLKQEITSELSLKIYLTLKLFSHHLTAFN